MSVKAQRPYSRKVVQILPVCGIIVVKRKITANLAVIFLEMVDLIGIEPTTLRMRTVRSPMGERNMPLKYCRKGHIKHRKRKENVRISQPEKRQGQLLSSLSLPFADVDINLWCATHVLTEPFASQVCFGDANIALSTAFASINYAFLTRLLVSICVHFCQIPFA